MSKARLMTVEEALEWCDLESPKRSSPVYHEYICTWMENKPVCIEKINPYEDFMSADIVGYGQTNRLWTNMPTEEQMQTPWEEKPLFE